MGYTVLDLFMSVENNRNLDFVLTGRIKMIDLSNFFETD